jgi:hypothetical protein
MIVTGSENSNNPKRGNKLFGKPSGSKGEISADESIQEILDYYNRELLSNSYRGSDYNLQKYLNDPDLSPHANGPHKNNSFFYTPVLKKDKALNNLNNKFNNNFNSQSSRVDKMKFAKIGMDVINSGKVLVNFNKPNGKFNKNNQIPKKNLVIDIDDVDKEDLFNKNSPIKHINSSNKRSKSYQIKNKNFPKKDDKKTTNIHSGGSISPKAISRSPFKNKLDENFENSVNFLCDLSLDNFSFINHLKLFECHMEIDPIIETLSTSKSAKQTENSTSKLITLLNKYFTILRETYNPHSYSAYTYTYTSSLNQNLDSFFIYQNLNTSYQRLIKLQILIMTIFIISVTQLNVEASLKSHMRKVFTNLNQGMVLMFENFIMEESTINYSEIITKNLDIDFFDKFNKMCKVYKSIQGVRNSDLLSIINKNIDGVIISVKQIIK